MKAVLQAAGVRLFALALAAEGVPASYLLGLERLPWLPVPADVATMSLRESSQPYIPSAGCAANTCLLWLSPLCASAPHGGGLTAEPGSETFAVGGLPSAQTGW